MRSISLLLCCITMLVQASFAQTENKQQIDNVSAFAKLYGYIKYFHPSDEAASIDWNAFAIYGCSYVLAAKNSEELLQNLQSLFCPLAPSIKIYKTSDKPVFDVKNITPPDANRYKPVVWQHYGVGLGQEKYIYRSTRANRPVPKGMREWAPFKPLPAPGEIIQKSIAANIEAIVPLVLFGDDNNTWPVADKVKLDTLRQRLIFPNDSTGNNLLVRLSDVVIAWNVFKHFFSYWEDASATPATLLSDALTKAMTDKTALDFHKTLKLMTAPLNDGHIGVQLTTDTGRFYTAPLLLAWAENQLVVDKVVDKNLQDQFAPGDTIESIDGIGAAVAIQNAEQYISGSPQLKRIRSLPQLLTGYKNTSVTIGVKHKGIVSSIVLTRSFSIAVLYKALYQRPKTGLVKEGIYYIDLDSWPMDSINNHLDELKNAKAVICDLRGYPNSNHKLIEYLLTKDEDTKWMYTPKIVYPDFEKVSYQESGWSMHASKPHLNAKMIFITDAVAISYAESYMGYIKDFKLATIVGQPTAGTNGNINLLTLPGGYRISFTGMLVKNHDGSKHHLKGIVPDVPVERTINGIAASKDELLEKAIELAAK